MKLKSSHVSNSDKTGGKPRLAFASAPGFCHLSSGSAPGEPDPICCKLFPSCLATAWPQAVCSMWLFLSFFFF